MSGIIGIKKFYKAASLSDQNTVERVLQKQGQSHSAELLGNTVLSYPRLSIMDQNERANQPFYDDSKRYSLVFNGEIYNYQDLKNDLLGEGISFKTASDTEILLHYLIIHGENGLKDLVGEFAFAFYDSHEDELLLARDFFGVKPLLFAILDEEIVFASELMPFKYFLSDWTINNEALNAYFRFTYVPAPLTMIKEVSKLLPGHYLKVKKGDFDLVKYYSPREQPSIEVDYEEAKKEVKFKLENAVINRMQANVPIASFLSGGVDSSIVSQIASTFHDDLRTFSIGFEGNEFLDESPYAQRVAEHIKTHHQLIKLDSDTVAKSFLNVLEAMDEPFADSSAVAMYFLAKEAKKQVSVCLSGDAADEVFAGYNKHKAYLKSKKPGIAIRLAIQLAKWMPGGNRTGKVANKIRQVKKFQQLLQKPWPESYWYLAQFISQERRKSILLEEATFTPKLTAGDDNLQCFLYLDQQFILPNDMLKKVDMMSRYHGLEVRVPFLDRELVDYVNSLPENYKHDGKTGKRILKEAFEELLPEEVFSRAKRGFEIPLKDWMVASWKGLAKEEWFTKDYLTQQNLFSLSGINQLKQEFDQSNEEEATVSTWAYLVFQNWYHRWIEK